ncbi:hypothetical protein SAMN04489716_2251 [Actinoplanes derwentensis]|uniref:DUF2892 domain-containing protein n=2 Tax=Actinoplanes derwentensis TaxID=113562 RepID=A0A1H1WVI9_9ACTN|nr:hypothetical protein Ade03nite_58800 [Actinoplanes derwentensis]SDT01203.1 hypothetical protein SAMN04489716_2251 [Actinoplanes derwentensis]
MQPMTKPERRTQTSRIVGNLAIGTGLLLTVTGEVQVLAALLVLIGVGLRIEAAVTAGH